MEDAYVLAGILSNPLVKLDNVAAALKIYEEIRLPHGNYVQRRSALAGDLSTFNDPRFEHLVKEDNVSPGALWEIGHTLVDIWKWSWVTEIEDDRKRAMQLAEERLARL